ncbi:MAG TPA: SDR family NAD(P)-dependent oxidoreductase [Candidatus Bathyarchaeia archaeon]|nr:SDR family NAD(P)-dependent oxidoreductase [Candidatus Bathyarchaeia archaeon]
MSQEGAKVVICARNQNALKRAAKEIEAQAGNEILPVKADLMKPEEIKVLVNNAAKHFNKIDILINNTGGPPRQPSWSLQISSGKTSPTRYS